jgi:hypothetical protein
MNLAHSVDVLLKMVAPRARLLVWSSSTFCPQLCYILVLGLQILALALRQWMLLPRSLGLHRIASYADDENCQACIRGGIEPVETLPCSLYFHARGQLNSALTMHGQGSPLHHVRCRRERYFRVSTSCLAAHPDLSPNMSATRMAGCKENLTTLPVGGGAMSPQRAVLDMNPKDAAASVWLEHHKELIE